MSVSSALAGLAYRRQLAAVPPEHRTPAMRRAQRDLNIGAALLATGALVAVLGLLLPPAAGRFLILGGLGCLGVPGLGWLWSGREAAIEALAPFRDEAPWGSRPGRRRYAKDHEGNTPDDGAA